MSGAVLDLDGVLLLDTRFAGESGTVGVFLLPLEAGEFALIESGPASTLPQLEEAIAEAGFELSGLRHVFLTHIHLDHAAAAGALARRTGATVWAHHRGVPHLADPARLLGSARRIYGERLEELFGEMESVPRNQLRALFDNDEVVVSGKRIEALETPGHASHHLALLLGGRTLFTGDAAGIRLGGSALIRPAVPPPEVDLEAWEDSLAKMRAALPDRLLLTHFGEVDEPDRHLSRVAERNREWALEILAGLRAGEEAPQLEARMAARQDREFAELGVPEELARRYRASSDAAMTAAGLARYWRKLRPEALA